MKVPHPFRTRRFAGTPSAGGNAHTLEAHIGSNNAHPSYQKKGDETGGVNLLAHQNDKNAHRMYYMRRLEMALEISDFTSTWNIDKNYYSGEAPSHIDTAYKTVVTTACLQAVFNDSPTLKEYFKKLMLVENIVESFDDAPKTDEEGVGHVPGWNLFKPLYDQVQSFVYNGDDVLEKNPLAQIFSLVTHDHGDKYAYADHNHDGVYSHVDHNHDDRYELKGQGGGSTTALAEAGIYPKSSLKSNIDLDFYGAQGIKSFFISRDDETIDKFKERLKTAHYPEDLIDKLCESYTINSDSDAIKETEKNLKTSIILTIAKSSNDNIVYGTTDFTQYLKPNGWEQSNAHHSVKQILSSNPTIKSFSRATNEDLVKAFKDGSRRLYWRTGFTLENAWYISGVTNLLLGISPRALFDAGYGTSNAVSSIAAIVNQQLDSIFEKKISAQANVGVGLFEPPTDEDVRSDLALWLSGEEGTEAYELSSTITDPVVQALVAHDPAKWLLPETFTKSTSPATIDAEHLTIHNDLRLIRKHDAILPYLQYYKRNRDRTAIELIIKQSEAIDYSKEYVWYSDEPVEDLKTPPTVAEDSHGTAYTNEGRVLCEISRDEHAFHEFRPIEVAGKTYEAGSHYFKRQWGNGAPIKDAYGIVLFDEITFIPGQVIPVPETLDSEDLVFRKVAETFNGEFFWSKKAVKPATRISEDPDVFEGDIFEKNRVYYVIDRSPENGHVFRTIKLEDYVIKCRIASGDEVDLINYHDKPIFTDYEIYQLAGGYKKVTPDKSESKEISCGSFNNGLRYVKIISETQTTPVTVMEMSPYFGDYSSVYRFILTKADDGSIVDDEETGKPLVNLTEEQFNNYKDNDDFIICSIAADTAANAYVFRNEPVPETGYGILVDKYIEARYTEDERYKLFLLGYFYKTIDTTKVEGKTYYTYTEPFYKPATNVPDDPTTSEEPLYERISMETFFNVWKAIKELTIEGSFVENAEEENIRYTFTDDGELITWDDWQRILTLDREMMDYLHKHANKQVLDKLSQAWFNQAGEEVDPSEKTETDVLRPMFETKEGIRERVALFSEVGSGGTGGGVPAWDAERALPINNGWIVTHDGYIVGTLYNAVSDYGWVKVNGVYVAKLSSSALSAGPVFVPVTKNDKVEFYNFDTPTYYPVKDSEYEPTSMEKIPAAFPKIGEPFKGSYPLGWTLWIKEPVSQKYIMIESQLDANTFNPDPSHGGNFNFVDNYTTDDGTIVPGPAIGASIKWLTVLAIGGSGESGTLRAPILTPMWFDHDIVDDPCWVKSDGTEYSAASKQLIYEHLVTDWNNAGETETETVGGVIVTFKRAEDGHKIINTSEGMIDHTETILELSGSAWYYVLDTTARTFKLPQTKYGFHGDLNYVKNPSATDTDNMILYFSTGIGQGAEDPASSGGLINGEMLDLEIPDQTWSYGLTHKTITTSVGITSTPKLFYVAQHDSNVYIEFTGELGAGIILATQSDGSGRVFYSDKQLTGDTTARKSAIIPLKRNTNLYIYSGDESVTIAASVIEYKLKTATLEEFAPIESPHFTGAPTAPTPESGAGDGEIVNIKYLRKYALTLLGGGIPLHTVTQAKVNITGNTVRLSWKDPRDTVIDRKNLAVWMATTIVAKKGSAPTSVADGLVITTSRVRNEYMKEPYEFELQDASSYVFRAFPATWNNVYNLEEKNNIFSEDPEIIYGYIIDESNPDEQTCVSVPEEYANFGYENLAMDFDHDVLKWGDWRDAFFMPKPCMLNRNGTVAYYLNPNDYTKKIDGTDADISDSEGTGKNAMVEWVPVFMSAKKTGSLIEIKISNKKVDETFECFSALKADGTYARHFYTPIYEGWIDADGALRSICPITDGQYKTKPSGNITYNDGTTNWSGMSAESKRARLNGSGWDISVWSDEELIRALGVLITGRLNSEAAISNAVGSSTGGLTNFIGTANDKGMFYGHSTTNAVNLKFFGMENWWGHRWRSVHGCVMTNGAWYVKMTKSRIDGSKCDDYLDYKASTDYTNFVDGYINTKMPCTNFGDGAWITKMYGRRVTTGSVKWSGLFLPEAASGGAANKYYCDGCWGGNWTTNVSEMRVGGSVIHGSICGLFALAADSAFSDAHWYDGASLSYKGF